MSESLESVLSVKAKEDLASALVHVLHHEGLAKEFIAELALQEILKSGKSLVFNLTNSIFVCLVCMRAVHFSFPRRLKMGCWRTHYYIIFICIEVL